MQFRVRRAEGEEVPTTTHHASPRSRGRHARRTPLRATAAPILEVSGVTADAPGGRLLLDDVSFAVQRGWLVAIVGPTGAGKTSLARALTGNLGLQSGSIRVDGVELTESGSRGPRPRRLRPAGRRAPRFPGPGPHPAVQRVAAGAAGCRGTGERDRRVDAALAELGLEHHAGVAVASLSGGQRKRANIAAELVGQPDVLVLDEPTSGLDPGYEKAVMTSLRDLADAGRTVIAVTHSMQALEKCDRVLFLAEGGRVAYFGPPARAAAYFGRGDAADVFLALDTEPGQAWKERFRAHPAYAEVSPDAPPGAHHPGPDGHWSPRGARARPGRRSSASSCGARWPCSAPTGGTWPSCSCRDRSSGLLIWLVVQSDSLRTIPHFPGHATDAAETVAMFVAMSATWLGASNAVREIVKERHILRREVDAGLFPSAYVASKAIVLGLVTMAQTTVLTLIACASQHPSASGALLGSGRVELAVVGALVGLAGTALGLLLSALATSPDKALALLPMTLVRAGPRRPLDGQRHLTRPPPPPRPHRSPLGRRRRRRHGDQGSPGAWLGAPWACSSPSRASPARDRRPRPPPHPVRPRAAGQGGRAPRGPRGRGPGAGERHRGGRRPGRARRRRQHRGRRHRPRHGDAARPGGGGPGGPGGGRSGRPHARHPGPGPAAPVVVPPPRSWSPLRAPVAVSLPTTPTTLAPAPTTTTVPATTPTTYVTPTTTKAPAAPRARSTAAAAAPAWWSPWFWFSWVASGGKG